IVELGWCRTFPMFPPKSKTLFPFQFGPRSCVSKYVNWPSLLVMNDMLPFLCLQSAPHQMPAFRLRFLLAYQRQNIAAKANHFLKPGKPRKYELRNACIFVFHECVGDFSGRADQRDRRWSKVTDRAGPESWSQPLIRRERVGSFDGTRVSATDKLFLFFLRVQIREQRKGCIPRLLLRGSANDRQTQSDVYALTRDAQSVRPDPFGDVGQTHPAGSLSQRQLLRRRRAAGNKNFRERSVV